uniref:Uncharacterized protein n=1 Tax=Meloidogyne enterolobii TaxID=390850 RepID=A0A6V7WSV4_MELEN|nr:unnamed protein product [Meloidogyne enterolobii]
MFNCIIIFFLLLVNSVAGHIILTFPEARYPPFDFLDNRRTLGPCGVPKSERSQLTSFQIGRNYNISWHIAKTPLKQENVKIRLLDYRGNELESERMPLLLGHGVTARQMTSAVQQSVEISFPFECRNCTLLIEKIRAQTNTDNSSLERSCAEVDISDTAPMNCFGNGIWEDKGSSGICQCSHGFSGQYCQYKDDCADDLECGPNGKCVADAIRQDHKSCFCQFGFFGTNCERNCYSSKTLNKEETDERDRLHWRLVGNQLEIILDFWTTNPHNWIGLGWRPLQIPPSCRLFPQMISSLEQKNVQTSGFSREWLEQPLHPMECVDMIMGSIREGNLLHIEDLYSRDMSSPLRDSLLDGEESLSAAYGLQTGNRSLLMLRRLISEIEPTDHPLGPGKIFLLYAKGESKIGRDEKYKSENDYQWKYHGSESTNRGHIEIEFVNQSQMNQIRVPLIHFDHSTENRHNNDGKDPNIVEPEKHLQQKNEKILMKNLTSSSNFSSFVANEHLIVDIPTAVVASNSLEVERQNEDDISSIEREKDVQDENEQNSSSSLPSILKFEIIRILVSTFLMVNLIVYII